MSAESTIPAVVIRDETGGVFPAVKAASTAPLATDPALVVSVSPNSIVSVTAAPVSATPGISNGFVSTASVNTFAVRATTYNEQTTNAQRSISSASVNDTAAGTGARTVLLTYYTSAGVGPLTETITLNGTTAVNTVATNICYVESIVVKTAGSGGVNAGILTLFVSTAGGGGTLGTIAASANETFWAHHYVATGKACHITSLWVGHSGTVVGSGGLFFLLALQQGIANAVQENVSGFTRLYGQSSTISRNYGTAIKVIGPARILMYVTTESSSALIYRGAFDFYDI